MLDQLSVCYSSCISALQLLLCCDMMVMLPVCFSSCLSAAQAAFFLLDKLLICLTIWLSFKLNSARPHIIFSAPSPLVHSFSIFLYLIYNGLLPPHLDERQEGTRGICRASQCPRCPLGSRRRQPPSGGTQYLLQELWDMRTREPPSGGTQYLLQKLWDMRTREPPSGGTQYLLQELWDMRTREPPSGGTQYLLQELWEMRTWESPIRGNPVLATRIMRDKNTRVT